MTCTYHTRVILLVLVWCRLVNTVVCAVWLELRLARLEQEHSHLPHIEVDKVLGLVCDI